MYFSYCFHVYLFSSDRILISFLSCLTLFPPFAPQLLLSSSGLNNESFSPPRLLFF